MIRWRALAIALCTIAAILAISVPSWSSTLVGSIYEGSSFVGSGWSDCPTPITWTTDTSHLPKEDIPVIRAELASAFAAWTQATGSEFSDAGELAVRYDDAQSIVRPVTSINRNIAIYFVPDSQSMMITKSVVGYASPSLVFADTKEIVNAYVVLSSDYLSHVHGQDVKDLMMHEIGHALGLADSSDPNNIMFDLLDAQAHQASIASGDIAGLKAIEKTCSTP